MNSKIRFDKFQVGEIYKLQDPSSTGKPRLVILAEIDDTDYSALAFLLNNMTEAAIPRDLNISKSKIESKFDVVLMTEYFSRIDLQNLDSQNRIGTLPKVDIEKIRSITNLPIVIGFGIKDEKGAKEMSRIGANGVVIGSALVKIIADSLEEKINDQKIIEQILAKTQDFSAAIKD